MLSTFLSRLIILIAGTLYPAYRSYKAVRNKDVREYVKWMMYWIVYALFTFGETIADTLIAFWFPFYYELKVLFVLWLLSPWTKGASILYRKWVHPLFMKHEEDIDGILEQAKSESYRQVLNLGSRGLMCAREIVASAALRGQVQLAQQLSRSVSLNDVHREREMVNSRRAAAPKAVNKSHLNDDDEEMQDENEQQVRTWTGYYDENNRIVEREIEMTQTVTRIDNEEIIVVEDPHESRPARSSRRNSRSRSRTIGIDDADGYNTLPRRSSRRNISAQQKN